jgi:hypothetical protein
MTAKVVQALPEGPEWLYELNLDGLPRALRVIGVEPRTSTGTAFAAIVASAVARST